MIIAYTDGSVTKNPNGHMGIGVVIFHGDKRTEICEYIGRGTNNIAELRAIEKVFDVARPDHITIHSDSKYSIGVLSMNWQPKVNVELIERIKEKIAMWRAKGKKIRFLFIRGHNGHIWNERADALAGGSSSLKMSWVTEEAWDGDFKVATPPKHSRKKKGKN